MAEIGKTNQIPSDNGAFRQVAFKMIQHYFKNDTFKKGLAAAIDEWNSKNSLQVGDK